MLCDNCGKNTATVHLTEIIDSQMSELHLCEECARKKSSQMEQQFGLSDLLAGMADFEKPAVKEAEGPAPVSIKCSNCGLAYADFKKMGRLGCGECYTSFKKFLAPLLKRIHGASQHVGKSIAKPEKSAKKKIEKAKEVEKIDIQELRKNLAKAVEDEAFEEAARLRDQIKEMETKASKGENES